MFEIAQHVTEAYQIGNQRQQSKLDTQINKIIDSVEATDLPSIDKNFIGIVKISGTITKQHKALLGSSVKYPLQLLAWEQTKISIAKNYPKLIYLLLGVVVLVILRAVNIIPEIFTP